MWKKTSLSTMLALSLVAVPVLAEVNVPQPKENKYINVEFLAVNDFHGNLNTKSTMKDANGKSIDVGGAQYLATHFKNREKVMNEAGGHTIRITSGDAVGASPSISSLLQDEPAMKILDTMKFDVGTLGNHEFDEGIPELNRLLNGDKHPKVTEYTKNFPDYKYDGIREDFKYVTANVVDKDKNPIFDPYTIKVVEGIPIGFIGITTTETAVSVMPEYVKDYKFLDEADTINKYAKILQEKEGVQAIVVVAHEGVATTGGQTTGVMAEVAKKLDPSVDIIFGAHSHETANGMVNGKLIVQAQSYLKAFADVKAQIDPNTNDFVKESLKAEVVLNTRDVEADPVINQIIDEADAITKPITQREIGKAPSAEKIGDAKPILPNSTIGNLVADGQRIMTKADFSMVNSGGIRQGLVPTKNANGENVFTWGAAYTVQPFGNQIKVVELTGQQIKDVLNQQWQNPDKAMYLQISGFSYTFEKIKDATVKEPQYRVVDVKLPNNTKLDMNGKYSVAINEFIASGGDNFTVFKQGKLLRGDKTDTEMFVEYLQKLTSEGKAIEGKVEGRGTELKGDSTLPTNPEKPVTPETKPTTPEQPVTPETKPVTPEKPVTSPGKDTLPNTATDTYNWLFAGAGALVVGGVMVMRRRKQEQ